MRRRFVRQPKSDYPTRSLYGARARSRKGRRPHRPTPQCKVLHFEFTVPSHRNTRLIAFSEKPLYTFARFLDSVIFVCSLLVPKGAQGDQTSSGNGCDRSRHVRLLHAGRRSLSGYLRPVSHPRPPRIVLHPPPVTLQQKAVLRIIQRASSKPNRDQLDISVKFTGLELAQDLEASAYFGDARYLMKILEVMRRVFIAVHIFRRSDDNFGHVFERVWDALVEEVREQSRV